MNKFNGSTIRCKSFNDVNFGVDVSGNVTLSDVDKVETALMSATITDTNAVIIGRINKFYNDQYATECSSVDKTSELQRRKMVLKFEDAGALIVVGKFPLDQEDLISIQTGLINKTLAGEKITSAVLGI